MTERDNMGIAHNLRSIRDNNGLPYAHLSRETLDYYESQGLIVQRRDTKGRRSGYCELTEAGKELIAR